MSLSFIKAFVGYLFLFPLLGLLMIGFLKILIQHILVFSFLLEKSIMDGVYVTFILVEHHLSFFFYFYILEELYLMVHTFIIQIFGFQEFFFSSS